MDPLSMLFWILGIIIQLIVIAIVGLIIYARWNYGVLEKIGIPVIKPHWVLGSNPNNHNTICAVEDFERVKKYGPVFGVYEGRLPSVYVADPKLIRRITTQDFEHFRNHRMFLVEHEILAEILDFLDDEKWKEVRHTLTPHFTTGKIKQMSEIISDISLEYVSALKKEIGNDSGIKMAFRQYVSPLVFEIIGKVFCGINIENARDPNNVFISNMKMCMGGEDIAMDWTFTFVSAFPIITQLFPVFPRGSMDIFVKTMNEILDRREKSNIKQQDMVNTLLEIRKKAATDPQYKKLGITASTALGQAFEFFIASYEGVRSVMTFLFYYLALNPEIQDRVHKELETALAKQGNKKINYDTVNEMSFLLTACITETMRLQPGFYRPDRRTTKDWEYDGMKIKKGTVVFFPLWAIHHDPNNYDDPESFNPNRFMPGNKEKLDPFAFGSFGYGPRACIGQRFAYELLKIIACNYINEFVIKKREDTKLVYIKGNPIFLTTEPILVDFVKRK